MTDRAIYNVPAEDIPPVQIAGVTDRVSIVDLTHIDEALNLARAAFKRAEARESSPDSIATLRTDLNTLSDAVGVLAAEVYNLALGIESGRIGIVRSTDL